VGIVPKLNRPGDPEALGLVACALLGKSELKRAPVRKSDVPSPLAPTPLPSARPVGSLIVPMLGLAELAYGEPGRA
jgi:hypothetical protein